jgi:hypothetical protein
MAPPPTKTGLFMGPYKGHVVTNRELPPRPSDHKGVLLPCCVGCGDQVLTSMLYIMLRERCFHLEIIGRRLERRTLCLRVCLPGKYDKDLFAKKIYDKDLFLTCT